MASALSPLGHSFWDPAPLSCLSSSQGGLFPWVFLQMSPPEQKQDAFREVQVAKEPLSEYRKFGMALPPGLCRTAAAPSPRAPGCAPAPRSSRLLALILSCQRPTCSGITPCLVSRVLSLE